MNNIVMLFLLIFSFSCSSDRKLNQISEADKRHTEVLKVIGDAKDINRRDALDGMTTLDYVELQIKITKDAQTKEKLDQYKELLISKGAKRSSELPDL